MVQVLCEAPYIFVVSKFYSLFIVLLFNFHIFNFHTLVRRTRLQGRDLSPGVAASYLSGNTIPQKARARINRGFVEKQKAYLQWLASNMDTTTSGTPTTTASSPPLEKAPDPIKLARRHARWIVTVQEYVKGVNTVLQRAAAKRAAALKQLVDKLNPPLYCRSNLLIDRFLDGTFVIHNEKDTVFETKSGSLFCRICEKDFQWPAQERAIKHVLSPDHHRNCKDKMDAQTNARSRQLLEAASTTAIGQ